MNRVEMKGLFKGLGIGFIISSSIFYGLVLNLRMDYEATTHSDEWVIEEARELGMIFRSELVGSLNLTDQAIIDAARKLGMEFEEE